MFVFWWSLRRERQNVSPARAGSQLFSIRFPRLAALARGYYSVALRARLKSAQEVIRMVAAGERSEPADPDVCFLVEPA